MILDTLLICILIGFGSSSAIGARKQLRSDVLYNEGNRREGRYKYGYAVTEGETQFHHQRSQHGAVYGCYGFVDPLGKLFITHYLADTAGYRLVNMAYPDRKLLERIQSLGSADHPVELQMLFPLECQADGDIKVLQETAAQMRSFLSTGQSTTPSGHIRSTSNYQLAGTSTVQSEKSTVRTSDHVLVKTLDSATAEVAQEKMNHQHSEALPEETTVQNVEQSTAKTLDSTGSVQKTYFGSYGTKGGLRSADEPRFVRVKVVYDDENSVAARKRTVVKAASEGSSEVFQSSFNASGTKDKLNESDGMFKPAKDAIDNDDESATVTQSVAMEVSTEVNLQLENNIFSSDQGQVANGLSSNSMIESDMKVSAKDEASSILSSENAAVVVVSSEDSENVELSGLNATIKNETISILGSDNDADVDESFTTESSLQDETELRSASVGIMDSKNSENDEPNRFEIIVEGNTVEHSGLKATVNDETSILNSENAADVKGLLATGSAVQAESHHSSGGMDSENNENVEIIELKPIVKDEISSILRFENVAEVKTSLDSGSAWQAESQYSSGSMGSENTENVELIGLKNTVKDETSTILRSENVAEVKGSLASGAALQVASQLSSENLGSVDSANNENVEISGLKASVMDEESSSLSSENVADVKESLPTELALQEKSQHRSGSMGAENTENVELIGLKNTVKDETSSILRSENVAEVKGSLASGAALQVASQLSSENLGSVGSANNGNVELSGVKATVIDEGSSSLSSENVADVKELLPTESALQDESQHSSGSMGSENTENVELIGLKTTVKDETISILRSENVEEVNGSLASGSALQVDTQLSSENLGSITSENTENVETSGLKIIVMDEESSILSSENVADAKGLLATGSALQSESQHISGSMGFENTENVATTIKDTTSSILRSENVAGIKGSLASGPALQTENQLSSESLGFVNSRNTENVELSGLKATLKDETSSIISSENSIDVKGSLATGSALQAESQNNGESMVVVSADNTANANRKIEDQSSTVTKKVTADMKSHFIDGQQPKHNDESVEMSALATDVTRKLSSSSRGTIKYKDYASSLSSNSYNSGQYSADSRGSFKSSSIGASSGGSAGQSSFKMSTGAGIRDVLGSDRRSTVSFKSGSSNTGTRLSGQNLGSLQESSYSGFKSVQDDSTQALGDVKKSPNVSSESFESGSDIMQNNQQGVSSGQPVLTSSTIQAESTTAAIPVQDAVMSSTNAGTSGTIKSTALDSSTESSDLDFSSQSTVRSFTGDTGTGGKRLTNIRLSGFFDSSKIGGFQARGDIKGSVRTSSESSLSGSNNGDRSSKLTLESSTVEAESATEAISGKAGSPGNIMSTAYSSTESSNSDSSSQSTLMSSTGDSSEVGLESSTVEAKFPTEVITIQDDGAIIKVDHDVENVHESNLKYSMLSSTASSGKIISIADSSTESINSAYSSQSTLRSSTEDSNQMALESSTVKAEFGTAANQGQDVGLIIKAGDSSLFDEVAKESVESTIQTVDLDVNSSKSFQAVAMHGSADQESSIQTSSVSSNLNARSASQSTFKLPAAEAARGTTLGDSVGSHRSTSEEAVPAFRRIPAIRVPEYVEQRVRNAANSLTSSHQVESHGASAKQTYMDDSVVVDQSMIPKLPVTLRTTTTGSSEHVTTAYSIPSYTNKPPVLPHPTTGHRPSISNIHLQAATTTTTTVTPEPPARTTVGPSGDVYDEIDEDLEPSSAPVSASHPTQMSPQIPSIPNSGSGISIIPSISSNCYEVILQIPADAKQVLLKTESSAFRVYGDSDPHNRVKLIQPGVYEINVGAIDAIKFQQYQNYPPNNANKLQLNLGKGYNYGEWVPTPAAREAIGVRDSALNNPYLPQVTIEQARSVGSAEVVTVGENSHELTAEQRALLNLVPSWKKISVLLT